MAEAQRLRGVEVHLMHTVGCRQKDSQTDGPEMDTVGQTDRTAPVSKISAESGLFPFQPKQN